MAKTKESQPPNASAEQTSHPIRSPSAHDLDARALNHIRTQNHIARMIHSQLVELSQSMYDKAIGYWC
jgi:hypothetical protein